MKKIFTLLLAAAMVFATVFSVFAAETEEMKAVLQQVKARIGSTDGYSNFYSESEDDEFFGTVYRFEWTISDDGAVLCINAAADGTILSYIIYGDEKTEEIPISQTLTKAELKEAAHGFIKQLNPEIADSFKPESVTFYRRFADVTFSEYKNGYPIKDSYASLEITKDGKKLRSLLLNYEGGKDFETGNIISKADAVKSFSEKLGLELYYDVTREWDDALSKHKTTVTPTYSPKDTDKFISAINGDVFEESGSLSAVYGANYKFDDMESSSAEDSAGGFSQAEIIEIENTEGLISKEKAFEILKNASCLDFPDITISDVTARLSRNDFNNSKEYSFSYRKTNGKITSLMNARVNAESGEILSLNIRELGGTESEAEEISNEKTL